MPIYTDNIYYLIGGSTSVKRLIEKWINDKQNSKNSLHIISIVPVQKASGAAEAQIIFVYTYK